MTILFHLPPRFMQLSTHSGFGYTHVGLMSAFAMTNFDHVGKFMKTTETLTQGPDTVLLLTQF